jgi:hypothetical protein
MLVDRDPDREVKHLEWRIRIFGGGAILALVGLYFEAGWMIWVAIGVLVAGFLLRFLPRRDPGEDGHRSKGDDGPPSRGDDEHRTEGDEERRPEGDGG